MSRRSDNHIEARTIKFPNGNSARLLAVPTNIDVGRGIAALELSPPRALLVLNGGTATLDEGIRELLGRMFAGLARVVVEERITVITGGTNAGIFTLFGEALSKWGGPEAPCIGVAVARRAGLKGFKLPILPSLLQTLYITLAARIGLTSLEPHHTHFVLVEGDNWGEETPVMYKLAAELASGCPSLAIFAGGGAVAITEMLQNVAQGRQMILVAGSGGVTDTVVAARSGSPASDERIQRIAREGQVTPSKLDQSSVEVPALIRSRLLGDNPSRSYAPEKSSGGQQNGS